MHAAGSACTTDVLVNVVLGIAGNRGTIEAVCAALVGMPDPETIRRYLNAQQRGRLHHPGIFVREGHAGHRKPKNEGQPVQLGVQIRTQRGS